MAEIITDALVRGLDSPPSGNRIAWDAQVRGFGVRITKAGARAFVLQYRIHGRERRYTIGAYPDWSVRAARETAKALKRDIDLGRDPLADVQHQREAPTVADLIERFKSDALSRNRPATAKEYVRMLDDLAKPALGSMKVDAVAYKDVSKLHRDVSGRAPYRANRLVAVLSKMFNWAKKEGLRSGDNPCQGVEKNYEEARERFLTEEELFHVSEALQNLKDPRSANAIRLLLLTGARRGEVLGAKWEQFHLAAGVWTKPSAHTKQKKTHRVPLSEPARELLRGIQSQQGTGHDYVFPGDGDSAHLSEIKKAWASVTRRATISMWAEQPATDHGRLVHDLIVDDILPSWKNVKAEAKARGVPLPHGITDVRIHDLRHTFASVLASAGQSLPIIGALLGHTQTSTTARYAHLIDGTLRSATELAGVSLMGDESKAAKARRLIT